MSDLRRLLDVEDEAARYLALLIANLVEHELVKPTRGLSESIGRFNAARAAVDAHLDRLREGGAK